jgi:hypothetical protein
VRRLLAGIAPSGSVAGSRRVQKQIKVQTQRMWLIMISMIGLCIWQWNFVWGAIASNIYMNGTIIVAFLATCVIAFWKIAALKKDVVAMHALKEMWDDVREDERSDGSDPFRKHYRVLQPGIVFQPPKILGHAYELVLNEIGRTGRLAISVNSMSTLMHKIDAKLADERSILNYMSGLLVFMGLIGAFLGLLKMVGSIGGILGGLSSAGGGGGGSNADAFNKLLTDLQAPLGGMATGFASSLFGLFGSLVVGLLGRFVNDAATSIKHEFEDWLATVVQIERTSRDAAPAAPAQPVAQPGVARAIVSVDPVFAQAVTMSIDRSNKALLRSAEALERLVAEQTRQGETMADLSGQMREVTTRQTDLQGQIGLIQSLGTALQEMRADIGRMEHVLDRRLVSGFTDIGRVTSQALGAQAALVEQLARQQVELSQTVSQALAAGPSPADPGLLRDVQVSIAEGFGSMSKVLDASNRAVAHGLMLVARQQANPEVKAGPSPQSEDMALLLRRLDERMGAGLTQLSRTVEDAFAAYAQTVVTRAAQPQMADPLMEAPVPHGAEPAISQPAISQPAISQPAPDALPDGDAAARIAYLKRFYEAARGAYREGTPPAAKRA